MANPQLNPLRQPNMRRFLEIARDYGPQLCDIDAESYQIPPQLINLVQQGSIFQGNNMEDPVSHLTSFLNLCNTYKNASIPTDKLRIMLFPFSLRGAALDWFYVINGPIHETFEEIKRKFVCKYTSPTKMEKLRNELFQFRQHDSEDLAEAWERFNEALRKCPNLPMEQGFEYSIFIKGLKPETRNMVNACAGGNIIDMGFWELEALISKLVEGSRFWPDVERTGARKAQQLMEVNPHALYQSQLDVLTKQMKDMTAMLATGQTLTCGICQQNHHQDQCLFQAEQANMVNNYVRPGNQYGNQGYQSNQNTWKGNNFNSQANPSWYQPAGGASTSNAQHLNRGPPGFQNHQQNQHTQQRQGGNNLSHLESMMQTLMDEQAKMMTEIKRTSAKADMCVQKVDESDTRFKSLESQVSHLTTLMQQRQPGALPSNTEIDPRGKAQCKAVMVLRGGKKKGQEDEVQIEDSMEEPEEDSDQVAKQEDVEDSNRPMKNKKKENLHRLHTESIASPANRYEPQPPFPVRKPREKALFNKKQFEQFVNLLQKVNVNISCYDLITSIPKYAKFVKDLIANKDKAKEQMEVVPLSASCSMILRKDIVIPEKVKDPDSCTIPCDIGARYFAKALCDLGSGVSIIPQSLATLLDLIDDMQPVNMLLQLADKSLVKPQGIIENVLVKVGKFIIPVDLVVLDIEEDKDVPILFGRPFLATGDALIGVKDRQITFRVNGEQVQFDLSFATKHREDRSPCCAVDVIDDCVEEVIQESLESQDLDKHDAYSFQSDDETERENNSFFSPSSFVLQDTCKVENVDNEDIEQKNPLEKLEPLRPPCALDVILVNFGIELSCRKIHSHVEKTSITDALYCAGTPSQGSEKTVMQSDSESLNKKNEALGPKPSDEKVRPLSEPRIYAFQNGKEKWPNDFQWPGPFRDAKEIKRMASKTRHRDQDRAKAYLTSIY